MTGRRGMAVATALLLAALATAGCGLGPGAGVGEVQLTVTREYGRVPVLDRPLEANESDTVMRLLEGEAEIATRYGGGFVHSIEGVGERQRGGDPYDWFFYVDGTESPIGAAEYELEGGERVWWDYRDWSATNHVPAVVGSWPAPFSDGIGGKSYPVAVECREAGEACQLAREALEREGVRVSSGTPDGAIRMLVGPWQRLRTDPVARLIEGGPAESGVYAELEATGDGYEVVALDEDGEVADRLGSDAGLVAATSRYEGPPVWVVTGGTGAAVRDATQALDADLLRDHYAVALAGSVAIPLPLEEP
ncbi:MAG TPA: DUF4430 domain-containing protein [Solirubrobacterales bacterium]|nr:DUF4430 domain-containing protein [Solirubrobacterales bacterium]